MALGEPLADQEVRVLPYGLLFSFDECFLVFDYCNFFSCFWCLWKTGAEFKGLQRLGSQFGLNGEEMCLNLTECDAALHGAV